MKVTRFFDTRIEAQEYLDKFVPPVAEGKVIKYKNLTVGEYPKFKYTIEMLEKYPSKDGKRILLSGG